MSVERGVQIARAAAVAPRTADGLLTALRIRGVRRIAHVRLKDNRTRLLSLSRDGATLHAHVCFRNAPETVLDAIAGFLLSRRGTRAHVEAVAAIRRWALSAPEDALRRPADRETAPPRPGPCCGSPDQRRFLEAEYRRLNAERFGGRLPPELPLRFSGRMRSRLGHVRYHRGDGDRRIAVELALNPDLLLAGNEAELHATLLHEMAHVEAWIEHGDRGHGAAWKRIARRVGCEARACTRLPVRRRARGAPPPTRVPHARSA